MSRHPTEPRQGRRKIPVAMAVVAVLAAAGAHTTTARIAAAGAVIVVAVAGLLILRWRWGQYRSGGVLALLRRRKFQGTATRRELRRKLSIRAARRISGRLCPDLDPAWAPVVLGRAKRRIVAGTRRDSYLVLAPPQTLKTALIGCWAADAPGPLLATSSRGDLYRHTAVDRSRLGDVWVLNADGDQGIPCDLAWSPVAGCRAPLAAIRRAGDLMAASPRDASGRDAWHEDRGAALLRFMLHAAALDNASMYEVAAWVRDPLSAEPMSILDTRGELGWADELAALTAHDGDWLAGVISSAEAAIRWMDDPVLKAVATPAAGGFDPAAFMCGSGSVYLIGTARPHGSLATYFAALTSEVFHAARTAAEDNGGRLPIPFTMALDEAATICPVPLPAWSSVAAGYNITLMAGIQAPSQLTDRWGEQGAATIRSNFTTEIIGEGFKDPAELERLSAICGEEDTWHQVRHPDGSRSRQPERQRLYPPERIRRLGPMHALVLHRAVRPVEVAVTPVWERSGYEAMPPVTVTRPERTAVGAAPRRAAIVLPYRPELTSPANPEEISYAPVP